MNPSLEELNRLMTQLIAPEQVLPVSTPTQPPPPADAAAQPASPLPHCQIVDFKAKGVHLDVTVTPGQLLAATQLLDQQGFSIDTVTGVDWMAAGQMEVIYDFFHLTAAWQVVLRTRVPRENPEVPTISTVFPGANWHERETHEFFGIRFLGHPNLTPLLLPEDATYHPLRKDFAGVR